MERPERAARSFWPAAAALGSVVRRLSHGPADTLRSGGCIGLDEAECPLESELGLGADGLSYRHAIAVENEERDPLYVGVVGEVRLIVDVDLADLERSGSLGCDLFDYRAKLPAEAAPRSPVIDQDGDV
jgi:hypothetical protein